MLISLDNLGLLAQALATFSTGIFIIFAMRYFRFIQKELIANLCENTRLWKQHEKTLTILNQFLLNDKALHDRILKLEKKYNLDSSNSNNLNGELRTELDRLDKEFASEFSGTNKRRQSH
jgi:hypothetical protein